MNLVGAIGVFIARPVATTLLTLGVAMAGTLAYFQLPVAPLPQVEFPTISVNASMPGASPETMAATVATPLERALGAISGVTEMTSYSTQSGSRVTLQFELSRDIDSASRDVAAAIQAALPLLPSGMPSAPSYRKVNPADQPVLILSLTSEVLGRGELYDIASTLLAQRLSQVEGVGQVNLGGGALPAVRIELDPDRLLAQGMSLEDVRLAVVAHHGHRPKGQIDDGQRSWQIESNGQARKAADFAPLVLRYQDGRATRLSDVAEVLDSVQDIRNYGATNGKPSITLMLQKQPEANVLQVVDRVRSLLPALTASLPDSVELKVVLDRTPNLRGSIFEIQKSLAISVALVILVVGLFLRRLRAALIPSVAVPVSLAGALGVMYLLGYSLNNLSLMALTIATGFVVDDAIVVLENVTRRLEKGDTPWQAALEGTRQIAVTVVVISLSLIAAFIPVILMGGVLGRLFQEFAVVLCAAILISMVVSLTTTPMMCAALLTTPPKRQVQGRSRWRRFYARSLGWSLRHPLVLWMMLLAVVALNINLYQVIPKGFFPQQDTGRIFGSIRADQSSSFQIMQQRLDRFIDIVRADPAVQDVTGYTGGFQRNSAWMSISLKPRGEREASADQVVARLRTQLAREPGARLFMVPGQDLRFGARTSSSQFEYTVKADDLEDLKIWGPRIRSALMRLKEIEDISTEFEDRGLQTALVIDREAVARLGLSMRDISTALQNAYGQRQIGVIYNPLNQYRVVLEIAPRYLQDDQTLQRLQFINDQGRPVPLSAFARLELSNTALGVGHDSGVPSDTFSFNLAPGVSLSQATDAVKQALDDLRMPIHVRGSFSGSASAFQRSLESQPLLILTALITLYLLLGMLYESLLHPITILSTLPSAGVGALLALLLTRTEFSLIALIGVILLIGIVKKNAILMIDLALQYQRAGASAPQAILRAALRRARPIFMTTLAAMLGALPLALGQAEGAELRQPLGLSVLGGLLLSQLLTLYTTPVVFVTVDRWRQRYLTWRARPLTSSP
jgi:multidrug efflux pump